jgi:hypothetical protein
MGHHLFELCLKVFEDDIYIMIFLIDILFSIITVYSTRSVSETDCFLHMIRENNKSDPGDHHG